MSLGGVEVEKGSLHLYTRDEMSTAPLTAAIDRKQKHRINARTRNIRFLSK